jgi:predicted dehydrogenase
MKAALLGAGNPHFDGHLRTLQELPEVEGIFIWGENTAALEPIQQSEEQKIEGVVTDLGAILDRPDIFFVIATLRTDLKPDLFVRILESGKHLMAEKPIGRTTPDVQRVVDTAERTGMQLGVCYQNRYSPLIREVRNLVGQGLLGPLMSVEMRMLTTQVKFRDPQGWLFRHEYAGSGILGWLGCHYIDMMRYITHDEIVSVSAEVATRSGEDIDVEDVATLSLRLRSGAIASLHAGYTLALHRSKYPTQPSYDTYVGLNGRDGRIHWSSPGDATHLNVETTHNSWAGAPQREFDYTMGDSPAYGGISGEHFIRDFIYAAQGKGTPPASGRDALQAARIIDAALESSQSGRRIAVEIP